VLKHDWLAMALVVVVAAPVGAVPVGAVPVGAAPVCAVPGTTQADWQVAACELQAIMQFVVVEVCASRIVLSLAADVLTANPAIAAATKTKAKPRTSASSACKREGAE
jgi:hypothetical protein